jgi:hypothetical protein
VSLRGAPTEVAEGKQRPPAQEREGWEGEGGGARSAGDLQVDMSSGRGDPGSMARKKISDKRREQLRRAKQAQRDRERARGLTHVQLVVPREVASKLAAAGRQEGFGEELGKVLDELVVRVADFPALRDITWSLKDEYLRLATPSRLRTQLAVPRLGKVVAARGGARPRLAARFGHGGINGCFRRPFHRAIASSPRHGREFCSSRAASSAAGPARSRPGRVRDCAGSRRSGRGRGRALTGSGLGTNFPVAGAFLPPWRCAPRARRAVRLLGHVDAHHRRLARPPRRGSAPSAPR